MKKIYTVFDYLEWRGDLTLRQSPMNEVDNLILSMCVFINCHGIVPPYGENRSVFFPEAVYTFTKMPEDFRAFGLLIPGETEKLAVLASHCARFRDVRLSDFVNTVDEETETQFCAMTYHMPDGSLFVAFRGTDDTLVGWKEDMNLSFCDKVPAQEAAVRYVENIASRYPGGIRLGGHSKGGNLSIYAAVHANAAVRDRVIMAYSNDGPGFMSGVLQSEAYRTMQKKLITFIPQSSLVGAILDHDEHYHIIRSSGNGVMQHDPFSWEVHGTSFVYLPERSSFGKRSARAARAWIADMSLDDRAFFADTVYKILRADGARTVSDFGRDKLRAIGTANRAYRRLDPATRTRFRGFIQGLIGHLNRRDKKTEPEKKQIPGKTQNPNILGK